MQLHRTRSPDPADCSYDAKPLAFFDLQDHARRPHPAAAIVLPEQLAFSVVNSNNCVNPLRHRPHRQCPFKVRRVLERPRRPVAYQHRVIRSDHDGASLGFRAVAPIVVPAAYTVTNHNSDKVYDADATSVDELADVLGSVVLDLINQGLLAGSVT